MSKERVRYQQTRRAGRCWVAGGVASQSQSAGGYAPSSRLASNPPSPGALIPTTERKALDEFGEPDWWRAWEANHESGSDFHFGGRRRGNSFFATYASWRLCVSKTSRFQAQNRANSLYIALIRAMAGSAPPVVRFNSL